jgi:NADP-dependent aldehyde dehydrogenase
MTESTQVESTCARAADAAALLADTSPKDRALMLRAIADALDAESEALVQIAAAETSLPTARLHAEVLRTSHQLRFFGAVLEDGDFLEVIVDEAKTVDGSGHPDVRRWLVPVGPVAVFGSSNFPFAFSVLGGDTASAIAAGCPVVVKSHPGHPRLCVATRAVASRGLATLGAPLDVVQLVGSELETGQRLVQDPSIAAVAFTGSFQGAQALSTLAAARAVPIPFYGEMGGVNPVVVTRQAIAGFGLDHLATGFAHSYTLGTGQYCTSPGVIFAPTDSGFAAAVAVAIADVSPSRMLNSSIYRNYQTRLSELMSSPNVDIVYHNGSHRESDVVSPTLLTVRAESVRKDPSLVSECFGPSSVVVEYSDESELVETLKTFQGILTATIWGHEDDPALGSILPHLACRAGRLVWNSWPTGVAVNWAMHHGGPFPAALPSLHTSVGATAVRRFLRPIAWQGWPQSLLPPALRDSNPLVLPRRLNGHRDVSVPSHHDQRT